MVRAFEKLFKQLPAKPWRIFSDKGGEFESHVIKEWLAKNTVAKYYAQNPEIKASLAERMIQTLKHRLYKYFTYEKTLNWIGVIDDITRAVNNSINRNTGLKPSAVNFDNAQQLWKEMYGNAFEKKSTPTLKVGDAVRVARERKVFDKGYMPTFSNIVYKIKKQYPGNPTTFQIANQKGRPLSGKWYKEELSKAAFEPDFKIRRVLKQRTRDGVKEYLIEWEDQPREAATWITEKDVLLLE